MSAGMQFVATSPNNPAGNERAVVSLLRHITGSAVLSALTLTPAMAPLWLKAVTLVRTPPTNACKACTDVGPWHSRRPRVQRIAVKATAEDAAHIGDGACRAIATCDQMRQIHGIASRLRDKARCRPVRFGADAHYISGIVDIQAYALRARGRAYILHGPRLSHGNGKKQAAGDNQRKTRNRSSHAYSPRGNERADDKRRFSCGQ